MECECKATIDTSTSKPPHHIQAASRSSRFPSKSNSLARTLHIWNQYVMATTLNQNEHYFGVALRFRGIDGAECDDFVYAIDTLDIGAPPPNRLNYVIPDGWRRADVALKRMTGAARVWGDSLDDSVKNDWLLLRQALLDRWPFPTTQTQQHIDEHVPTASPVASVVPAAPAANASVPPIILQPSHRLFPYGESDIPAFNIKVVAPKASYTGYVSKTFADSTFGARCSTLTDEQCEALEYKDPGGSLLLAFNSKAGTEWLDLYRIRSDGLCAMLTLMALVPNKQYRSDRMDGGRPNLNRCGQSISASWTVDVSGRLTCRDGVWKVMIGKDLDGRLTLHFCNRRVWDDDDDVYAAELYLVRSN